MNCKKTNVVDLKLLWRSHGSSCLKRHKLSDVQYIAPCLSRDYFKKFPVRREYLVTGSFFDKRLVKC